MAIESIIFFSVVGFVIVQRIVELFVARNNERWIRGQGGYEVGARHYPYMVGIHIDFSSVLYLSLWLSTECSLLLDCTIYYFVDFS
jgi:isoprenylcysteine carboxyl methyltransferase (ICMT) family protein YpbQ